MKKLSKIKLNQLARNELNKEEMGILIGGGCCTCWSVSKDSVNSAANEKEGKHSSEGCVCTTAGLTGWECITWMQQLTGSCTPQDCGADPL